MKRVAVTAMCAGLLTAGVMMNAQAPTPFKLGTFQLQNRTFIGIVVRDTQVIDFAAADSVIGRGRVAAPADMKQLIERYDAGVRERIYAVVKSVTSAQGARPNYVHELPPRGQRGLWLDEPHVAPAERIHDRARRGVQEQ